MDGWMDERADAQTLGMPLTCVLLTHLRFVAHEL